MSLAYIVNLNDFQGGIRLGIDELEQPQHANAITKTCLIGYPRRLLFVTLNCISIDPAFALSSNPKE